MTDTELLPCPFCGKHAVGPAFLCEAGRWDIWQVECGNCDISIESPTGFAGEAAKRAAIAAWNTRVTPPHPSEPLVERVAWAIASHEPLNGKSYNDLAKEVIGMCLAALPAPADDVALAQFGAHVFHKLFSEFCEGSYEVELFDFIQHDAVKAGIVTVVPFDPEQHTDETGCCELGDDYYTLSPLGRAALAKVRP